MNGWTTPEIAFDCALLGATLMVFFVIWRIYRRCRSRNALYFLPIFTRALRLLIPLAAVYLIVDFLGLSIPLTARLFLFIEIGTIAALGWIAQDGLMTVEAAILGNLDLKAPDNYEARGLQTRVRILRRLAVFLVWLVTLACLLLLFPDAKEIGKSILTSAGILGIVLGIGAQKTLGTLFAGLQLAFTQPIRLGDQVVVQGENGTVEEITLTYVVIRVWDLRRMIVPITAFLDQPFQNLSRTSTSIVTVIKIQVDFSMPVEVARAQVRQWLDESPLWDRQTHALLVTNSDAVGMELRITASAKNGAEAFALQCLLREKLLTFIQKEYPGSFPQARTVAVQKG